ncbi:TPA: class I SAM-dependent methyltransferase [archaeon]|nr:class I SAM-dependent methyltransferase [Candidatus Naiadarchaeales archaeon SRR2090153.bin461]
MEKFYDKFAKSYDARFANTNIPAAKFLADKISKLVPKSAKILDIGAGTGLLAEELARRGFSNITLLEFSKGMLAKAKAKKILKWCKFLRTDFKKQKFKGKYDLITSIFAFSCAPYFLEEEMPQLIKKVKSLLKLKGYFAVFGYDYEYLIEKSFRKISAGTKILLWREHSWFVGRN